jgi:hypothetical protein
VALGMARQDHAAMHAPAAQRSESAEEEKQVCTRGVHQELLQSLITSDHLLRQLN